MILHVDLPQKESGLLFSPLSSDVTSSPHSSVIFRFNLCSLLPLGYFLSFILLSALHIPLCLLVLVSVTSVAVCNKLILGEIGAILGLTHLILNSIGHSW